MQQRRKAGRKGDVGTAGGICHLKPWYNRCTVPVPGQAERSGVGHVVDIVPGEVAVGAILAVTGQRQVDQVGFNGLQDFVTKAPGIHYPGPELLDDHIGARYPFQDLLFSGLAPEIDTAHFLA